MEQFLTFLGNVGSPALVALFIVAILRGWLRPQSSVREVREDRDARLADMRAQFTTAIEVANARYISAVEIAEMYRKSAETLDAARRDQAQVLQQLMAAMTTVQKVLDTDGGDHGES